MRTYYFITTILFTFGVVLSYIRNRKILTIPNIVFWSVTVNFLLYLMNWSTNIREPVYDVTYYVIGTIQLIFFIYSFAKRQGIDKSTKYRLKKISCGRVSVQFSIILLVGCLLLCVFENYLMFGGLIASDSSSHTSSIPLISPMLKALYPVAGIAAFIDYDNSKKKSILIWAGIVLIYSIVGAKGRFWSLIALSVTLVYMSSRNYAKYVTRKSISWFSAIKTRYKVLIFAIIAGALYYLLNMGAARINTYTYAQLLGYNGPGEGKMIGDVLAWYYGYFPFSFYNLNTTLNSIVQSGQYSLGQFLLIPYAAFLHITDLLGWDYGALTYGTRIIQINVATVATGYYEAYKDFGPLFFISILSYVAITRLFEAKTSFFAKACFSYMAVVWFFMSFLNVYTVGVVVYYYIFVYIIDRYIAIREENTSE